jgi:metallo-beta-lactamase family protein
MKLISHGAAREVTGSCHELQIGPSMSSGQDQRILLDCGLFQGNRKKSLEKNVQFAFDPAKDIDAVVLSHAHMDHVGRIPLLYKKGYRGPVHCTYATKDLAHIMLQDGGYIQEKDEEFFRKHCPDTMVSCDGPLYTQQDAIDCDEIFMGKNYDEWFEVIPGVRATFLDAGHVLGAAMVVLEIDEGGDGGSPSQKRGQAARATKRMIGFSGDLGRDMLPIIRDPAEMPPVDVLICESTYGNREHEGVASAVVQLRDVVIRTAERGGKLMIPAFSLERTQEILYDLHILWDRKEIPAIPIVIDSPLASRVTEIFMKHPECYDKAMYDEFLAKAHNPFQFSLARFTESVQESKDLNNTPGPMIIMAGSGMCEAGRIRHHLKHYIEDPKSTVLAVGYMAENTLGRRLIEKDIRSVKIFDRTYQKKAETVYINAYSGHADKNDLDAYISSVADGRNSPLRKIFFVHGEETGMQSLAERTLRLRSGKVPGFEVVMPQRGVEYSL